MQKNALFLKAAALTVALTISTSAIALADTFKDVPSTHWAYEAVNNISSKGIIVGDLSGNFNPDSYIDKFETSKILAKVAGYKYTNLTEADRVYYDRVYQNNKAFIDQYHKGFTKWNSTADKEIAFLLEKQIYTSEDLNQFIIKNQSGKEQLRALSREELAVFLVRIMGKQVEASKVSITNPFADDSSITASRKNSVYYLRNLGIISGDSNNKFVPKGAVTKASMCVMLDKVLTKMNGDTTVQPPQTNTTPSNPDSIVNNIETITGTISKVFPSLNVIQINVNGAQKLYKITNTAEIKINNFINTINDLKETMNVVAVLNNSEIIQLNATSVSTPNINTTPNQPDNNITTNPSINTGEQNQNNNINQNPNNQNNNTNQNPTVPSVIPSEAINIEGTVSSTSDDFERTISIDFRILDTRGRITTQTQTYTLTSDCKIVRGNQEDQFSSILKGDTVNVKVYGNTVYTIELDEKNKDFTAILTEKKYDEATKTASLVVETDDGKEYELIVTDRSDISRKSNGTVEWNELRIGDTLEIKATYNKIDEIYAIGSKSNVDGIITNININEEEPSIDLKLSNGKIKTYNLINGLGDIYSLRVGDTVKLRLDSEEVESLDVKEEAKESSLTGYISSVKKNYITLKNTSLRNTSTIKIYFDKNTVFINSRTGRKVDSDELENDMKVYIILQSPMSTNAKTITILSE